MHTIVFATNNKHKLLEVQQILGNTFHLKSLVDIGFTEDIPEDFDTLEQNASQKAWYLYNRFGVDCFADDTGLEVDALDGKPGVYSARYAGEQRNSQDNIVKLLADLKGISNRKAQFRTVISLIISGEEHQFQGVVRGSIIDELKGSDGFGYDPIFVPEGYNLTFAEMELDLKNRISHRGLATQKLVAFLLGM
ncbi:MAG: non-canonical purine NTP diphosphatase [Tenuifilaceae bacterium]|jgi:XTP/dITP diphosphohydrolase|uniref:non-canonical purine NTP diphosphatase n=1 Tax=Perlabentimonas gracilis TaxID=2715279 RepID=UPI00140C0F99|nr:non-canonical purine NTP diphosphatase [Perlabentimonas gracilis]MDX9769692.1 non-canonical purine NTP diphosphatase [Tenuifilaceae bacterium]NHB67665.1 non-canonical purine NTP diphosphatase [Perlabentimonas gracilis]